MQSISNFPFSFGNEPPRNGTAHREQVEKIDPDLVARDDQGRAYTVRYEAVNAMLLNEFLKEHRKVEEQSGKQQKLEATVAQQQKEIAALTTASKRRPRKSRR